MTPTLKINGNEIAIKSSTFPTGENYIRIADDKEVIRVLEDSCGDPFVVEVTLTSPMATEIMDALLIVDAVKYIVEFDDNVEYILHCPYLPYSRQDRVCSVGESLSLKVFLKLVATQFNTLTTYDIHNPSATHSIVGMNTPNLKVVEIPINYSNSEEFLQRLGNTSFTEYASSEDTVFISVDKGALQRVSQAHSQNMNTNGIVVFDKVRDKGDVITTITPKGTELLKGAKYGIIVDDICDGGATFISIAKTIASINPNILLTLVVSHGVFSKGITGVLTPWYNSIEVANTKYNLRKWSVL